MFEKVDYLADLIRIELSDEERDLFSKQLGDILDYIGLLNEVDTDGFEPLYHPLPIHSRMRKDVEGISLGKNQVFASSKHNKDGYFTVPKVI